MFSERENGTSIIPPGNRCAISTRTSSTTTDETFKITIDGTNDTPVITSSTSDASGSVIEAGHNDDGTIVSGTSLATGTLTSYDVDNGSSATWTVDGGASSTGTYGSLAITSGGVWTYTLDNSLTATQALKEGQTAATETFTARVTDEHNAYAEQTITVTVDGTNDVPVVTSSTSDASGYVTEAGHNDDRSVDPGTTTTSGTLTSSDVDNGSSSTWTVDGGSSVTGTYGSLSITADGVWTYTLDNSLTTTEALKEGQTETETFTARVTDCLLYTSPSPRDLSTSRMPSSA